MPGPPCCIRAVFIRWFVWGLCELRDETLKGLNPVEERSEIESMKQVLCRTGKQAVVVLHSRSNLDCFETVVNLNG